MQNPIIIRSGIDRVRYTVVFEVLLISMLVPLGALVLEKQIVDVGALAIFLALKAMLFGLIYNWFFDRWDARAGRVPTERSFARRILHAAGFECGLVLTSLPLVTWWLGLSILQALAMDFAVTLIVVIYTFAFSWGYDRLCPVPQSMAPLEA